MKLSICTTLTNSTVTSPITLLTCLTCWTWFLLCSSLWRWSLSSWHSKPRLVKIYHFFTIIFFFKFIITFPDKSCKSCLFCDTKIIKSWAVVGKNLLWSIKDTFTVRTETHAAVSCLSGHIYMHTFVLHLHSVQICSYAPPVCSSPLPVCSFPLLEVKWRFCLL